MSKDEYSDYSEPNQEFYLSSAGYTNTWYYDLYKEVCDDMFDNKSAFACNLPYQLANKHGLLTDERIERIKNDKKMTTSAMQMEYGACFYNVSSGGYYSPAHIMDNRTIIKAWHPPSSIQWVEEKDKKIKSWDLPRDSKQELRVLACDIALSASSTSVYNDASAYTFIKANPKGEKYISEILHQETHEGVKLKEQCLRIKRLMFDGDVDILVLDTKNNGLPLLDELGNYTYDEERDIKYPPYKCINNRDYEERCGYKEAIPCLYAINATDALNSEIHSTFKASLENHSTQFLVNELQGEDFLIDHMDYDKIKDENRKADLLMPYIQASLMQNEIIELEVSISPRGYIKLSERSGNRKDRYSSVSYGIYYIKQQENKLKKKKKSRLKPLWN